MAEKTEVKVPQNEAFLEEKAFKSRMVLVFGEINDTLAYTL